MRKKIIIIGGGIGGLAVASRLAARGFQVEILEKCDRLGGKASGIHINGFTFDSGLQFVTSTFMLDDIFAEAGKKTSDFIHMVPLEPLYKVFSSDGKVFIKYRDQTQVQNQIERMNPVDKVGYNRLTFRNEQLYKKYFASLATKPSSFFQTLEMLFSMYRQRENISATDYLSKYIQSKFIKDVFSILPLTIGCNPFDIPAVFSMLQYMEKEWGIYYPTGGVGEMVNALQRLFVQLGGTIFLDTEVEEVIFDGRTAIGVRLTDKSIRYADIIISDTDTPYLFQNMLPEYVRGFLPEWRVESADYSMSFFILYLGVKQRYLNSGLVQNNIHLSRNFQRYCDDLFNKKRISDDLTLFINMPTFSDNTIAPPSTEELCIISPVPNLQADINWDKFARPLRDRILHLVEDRYLPDLRSNIVVEHHITPEYFQDRLNCHLGAAYSLQPTMFQSGWFRPHNKAAGLENFYLVGDGAHPGPGLASVLLSAKITADLI